MRKAIASSGLRDSAMRASWIASKQCAGSGSVRWPLARPGPAISHRHADWVRICGRSSARFWNTSSIHDVGVGGPSEGGSGLVA